MTKSRPILPKQRWQSLSMPEQMANIGSEVIRSLNWAKKNNPAFADLSNQTALRLFDLTLSDPKHADSLKEIARCRELWLDYFIGNNQYHQTASQWQRYFLAFNYLARNKSGSVVEQCSQPASSG